MSSRPPGRAGPGSSAGTGGPDGLSGPGESGDSASGSAGRPCQAWQSRRTAPPGSGPPEQPRRAGLPRRAPKKVKPPPPLRRDAACPDGRLCVHALVPRGAPRLPVSGSAPLCGASLACANGARGDLREARTGCARTQGARQEPARAARLHRPQSLRLEASRSVSPETGRCAPFSTSSRLLSVISTFVSICSLLLR